MSLELKRSLTYLADGSLKMLNFLQGSRNYTSKTSFCKAQKMQKCIINRKKLFYNIKLHNITINHYEPECIMCEAFYFVANLIMLSIYSVGTVKYTFSIRTFLLYNLSFLASHHLIKFGQCIFMADFPY